MADTLQQAGSEEYKQNAMSWNTQRRILIHLGKDVIIVAFKTYFNIGWV